MKPNRREEVTLEQLIERETSSINSAIEKASLNIAKLTTRMNEAVDPVEKERLSGLVTLHSNYKAELEAKDPIAIATEKFNNKNIDPILEIEKFS